MGRSPPPPGDGPGRFAFDDVVVERESYRVFKAGEPRALGPRAFDLLLDLLDNAGRVVEKQQLFDRVWKGAAVTDNALTRAIRELRGALGDRASAPRYIETVARRGYRFVAPLRPVTATRREMLVVLPFAELSPEPGDWFCDGLTEDTIAQLGRLDPERLGVIARTSAMAYKDTSKTVAEIGRELAVDYVLEGSVRRVASRVCISAQLVSVADQGQLWSGRYEQELSDVLRVQRRLALDVTSAIRLELAPAAAPARPIRRVVSEAYAACLRGRHLWNRRTAESMCRAIGPFQEALVLDPTYAPAHVGLARCYMGFMLGLLPRAESQPMAEASARRALVLDDQLAAAHAVLGALQSAERDVCGAEESFRRALMLDPNDPIARHWYAMFSLVVTGRFEAALAELRRAQVLDPLALIYPTDIAAVHCLMGEPDRCLDQCDRVLSMDPDFARAHLYAGWAHSHNEAFEEAVTELELSRRLDTSPWVAGWLGFAYGRLGRRHEATALLRELAELAGRGRDVAFFAAMIHAGLGDSERALDGLERAVHERSMSDNVDRHLAFAALRSHARFRELARRFGLPEGPAPGARLSGPR